MDKFERRLSTENKACQDRISHLTDSIKGVIQGNQDRGRPDFKLPDFGERISHVRRVVEHEISARDSAFKNKADQLLMSTMALEKRAIEDA